MYLFDQTPISKVDILSTKLELPQTTQNSEQIYCSMCISHLRENIYFISPKPFYAIKLR